MLVVAYLFGAATQKLGGGIRTGIVIGLSLRIFYQTLTVGRWGGTLGKLAGGMRVVTQDGAPVGYARAFGRSWAYMLSALLGDLGFMLAAVAPQKRALHDYIAGTRVVYSPAATKGRRMGMIVAGVACAAVGAVGFAGLFFAGLIAGIQSGNEKNGNYEAQAATDGLMIRISPKNKLIWNNRCWHRALAGRLVEALDDCDESLKLGRSAEALDSRGLVLLKMKRFDEAQASYGEALALDPKLAYSLYGRALARESLGDRAGRDADLAAARAADPKIDEAFARLGVTSTAP